MAAAAPATIAGPTETPVEQVNATIEAVASKAKEWAELPVARKLALLQQILELLDAETEAWVRTSCISHGYDPDNHDHDHLKGECAGKGPGFAATWLNAAITTYTALQETGAMPVLPQHRACADGSTAVTVFPLGIKEKIVSAGMRAEVVIASGTALKQVNPLSKPAGLCAILGAGNYDGPNDIVSTMFFENKVAVYKPNPVNHQTAPHTQRVFRPLIEAGFLAYVFGGAPVGGALCNHPAVDKIVITGSALTYDRIVWGPDSEQAARKAAGTRAVTKPIDAELGSVNPWVICPGVWTPAQLEAQAQLLAGSKMFNDGHICASPQIVVTSRNWPQREAFLARVRALLAAHPGTRPFYPGCQASYAKHCDALGADCAVANHDLFPSQIHPLFKTDVTGAAADFVTTHEAFVPVLAEMALDTPATAADFLPAATKFVHEKCWGSLTLTLIVDDATMAAQRELITRTVDSLQFGTVGINQAAMMGAMFGQLVWGAYPRHSPTDIQSGMGKLGNAYGFDGVIKAVMWAPFVFPAQGKVPTDRQAFLAQMTCFTRYQANPSVWRLARLMINAITKL